VAALEVEQKKILMKKNVCTVAAVLCLGWLALAEDASTALRPPKGSQVAIVVFEDLQCPRCREDAPLVAQAGKTYKIPIVRHDFPLPMHNWSFEAAVMAHYFDSQSKQLGVEFRDYIFQNQPQIFPTNLRQYAEKFASDHKVDLPFVVDPQGKFAAEVNAERDLGKSLNLQHTPTIFVVSTKPGKSSQEVTDVAQLYHIIDSVKN
jgi:protein-disulfide isomerase